MTAEPNDNPRHQYHLLEVAKVIDETPAARSLIFAIPAALEPLFRYRAGQFLTLEIRTDAGVLRRCYSLASSPDVESEHKVTIKRVEGGRVSNHINDRVVPGDRIAVLPPDGRFVLPSHDGATSEASAGALVFFAGGSGITPIISLIKSALATTHRDLLLVYCNRDERSVIFNQELRALESRHPRRLRVVRRLDDKEGYLGAAEVARLVRLEHRPECYLCGPTAFMDVIEQVLSEMKLDPARIHVEKFFSLADPIAEVVAAPAVARQSPPPAVAAGPPVLEVLLDGKTHTIANKPGKSILESAFAAGLDPPHSCQEGVCGSCIAMLCEGEVDMNDTGVLSKSDKQRNLIVTCQSKARTNRVKVDYSAI